MGSKVLQIGCGAIGSYTATRLPNTVTYVGLCDGDVVAQENLGIADFWPTDVGKMKVSALAERIRKKSPGVQAIPIDTDVSRVGPVMVDMFDVVLAAVDNDRASFAISRIVAQSETKPPIVFANCDPQTGSAQVRVVNFQVHDACLGCNRSRERWEAPLSVSYSCARTASRASADAAQLASALQVSILTDILSDYPRLDAHAGESLIINPRAGILLKSKLMFNVECPAFYHFCPRHSETTISLEKSVGDITLSDVFAVVCDALGTETIIELGERRYSDSFSCPACGSEVRMIRLLGLNMPCSCGGWLQPMSESHRISVDPTLVTDDTLRECGFPEGEVVLAISKNGYRHFSTLVSKGCEQVLEMRASNAAIG